MDYDKTARDQSWTPDPNDNGRWGSTAKPGLKYDNAKAVCDGEGLTPPQPEPQR